MLRGICRVSMLAALLFAFQATRILAGTTGALTGYVLLDSGSPVSDAKVAATAPSQTATTNTDTAGHFAFVSLAPDTYTVTASKEGYDTVTHEGVTVIADNTRTITLNTRVSVKTLGTVTSRASAELVKPGTTSDVYSINAATQSKVAALGGGGSLNQAYSALAATPGVMVPPGQSGWFQTIHIRGGDFDQVGYEFDGVPVLRSYDNYPTTTANTLGQQELQVYTGAAPADAQGQGLSGYINQVIKSGTYPGFSDLTMGIGTPSLYNGFNFEVGGATPDRNFSYFIASTNSTQALRYGDQFNNAAQQSVWGTPLANLPCPANVALDKNFRSCYASGIGPGGLLLGPVQDSILAAQVLDRENVVNLHIGLPHRNDAGKDDIQLLFDGSYLNNLYYSSASDLGLSDPGYQALLFGSRQLPYVTGGFCGGFGVPSCGIQYVGALGAPLASNYQALTHPVFMAYNPNSIGSGTQFIPFNQRDGTANPNSIVKVQYQHNFGSTAYFRIYGFSDYSQWAQTCPVTLTTAIFSFVGYCPFNYYVATNTNGGTATYGNQINDKNLLTINLSDFAAVDYRANDETMIDELIGLNKNTGSDAFAYAVNSKNPASGVCYTATGAAVSCYSGNALNFGLAQAFTGTALPTLPGSCGGNACEWFVAENGQYGGANYAKPNFGNISITDQIKPSNQWFINIGLREDRFAYNLSNTAPTAARTFWTNAWNNSYCVLPGAHTPQYNPANDTTVGAPCPAGQVPATFTNLPNDSETFWVFQPRLGATFTANPNDVFRLSAGVYDQAPNTAYEQYNYLNQDLPGQSNLTYNFWSYGFNTSTHRVVPPTSDNYDLSWEHHFAGTDTSFKLTPFYRTTKNQIQNFFLNQATGFVSGLNTGNQTSEGVEFQLNLGNFNQDGLSALLAYTYTHAYIHYNTLGNGTTVLDGINQAIQLYNSFTGACAGVAPNNSSTSLCGIYGSNGNAVATELNGVANPYFKAPPQARLDPNANYVPFTTLPNAVEAAATSYEVPNVAALILNYKHDKWSISPQFQYVEGSFYGDPLSGFGVDPSTCGSLGSGLSGDPRYPYGGTGTAFDALTCGGTIAVPDPYTHVFDSIGAFRQPNQFLMHAQLSYRASNRVTFTANVANIINTCFGGTKEAWTTISTRLNCGYVLPGYGFPLNYGANIYNPGVTFQPMLQFPYQENPIAQPVQAVFSVKVSL